MVKENGQFYGHISNENNGPAKNPIETHILVRHDLPELASYLAKSDFIGATFEDIVVERRTITNPISFETFEAILATHTFIEPPLKQKIVFRGGYRSYGGGTSKDAIRRARRQERKKVRKNK